MLMFFLGCAPKYAASESIHNTLEQPTVALSVQSVDFSEQSALVEELLSKNEDRDTQDRLYLIQDLIRDAQGADSSTQQLLKPYIDRLIQIEQRSLSSYDPLIQVESAPNVEESGIASSLEPSSVLEISLDEPSSQELNAQKLESKLSDSERQQMISVFRSRIEQGESLVVLNEIRDCGDRCWPEMWPVWADARDVYIDSQRRLFEEQYRYVLNDPEAKDSLKQLMSLTQEIERLVEAYPQAAQIDKLKRLHYLINQKIDQ